MTTEQQERHKVVVLGDETKNPSTQYYRCEGCDKTLDVKVDWSSGYNWESATKAATDLGWTRRIFAKYVMPWFCSKDCSINSEQAKEWEGIWHP